MILPVDSLLGLVSTKQLKTELETWGVNLKQFSGGKETLDPKSHLLSWSISLNGVVPKEMDNILLSTIFNG